ncbi:MAG TPA: antibiotic biosynthesis monooxygenase, partial [Chitinophagaceae bacterium]|nr:antibiotic biosynthesis monooxygenase [Chitinophagaceae bacterium]
RTSQKKTLLLLAVFGSILIAAQGQTSDRLEPAGVSSKVTILVQFDVKPTTLQPFKQAQKENVRNSKTEPGNDFMTLLEGEADHSQLFLYEGWKDTTALQHHFAMPYTKKVLNMTKAALVQPYKLRFLTNALPVSAAGTNVPTDTDKILLVVFDLKTGTNKEFIQAFTTAAARSRTEEGCISYHLFSDKDDPDTYVLIERWHSAKDFESHLQKPYIKTLFSQIKELLRLPVENSMTFLKDVSR